MRNHGNGLGDYNVHVLAFMQDVDVATDPANSCALFITVHSHAGTSRRPALSARFQFEDHIRCVAARQCLQRNRENLRLAKMTRVAKLLHLPIPDPTTDSLHLPLGLEEPNVGSFVSISPAHSPLSDLSRSGLHHALQHPPVTNVVASQDIEMAQFQLHSTVYASQVLACLPADAGGHVSSQSAESNPPSGQLQVGVASPVDALTDVVTAQLEDESSESPAPHVLPGCDSRDNII